jgi:regulator of replication initiation timing
MHAMRVNNADQDIGRLSSRIDLLQARFQKLTEEAAVMKIELSRFTQKLEVAEVLVEKLESEYARWSIQVCCINIFL